MNNEFITYGGNDGKNPDATGSARAPRAVFGASPETPSHVVSFACGRVSSRAGSDGKSRQEQGLILQDQQFQDYIRSARISPESFGEDFENIFSERHSGFGKKGDIRKRPEGAKLWAAIVQARGLYPDAQINLIFTNVDRIGRDWLETMIFMRDLRALKVRMHVILLGGEAFDCESATGQLTISILSWLAQNEVSGTQQKILRAINQKRDHDELLNGCAPYGWDVVPTGEVRVNKGGKPVAIYRLVPNEREQKWILHMLALRNAGYGWRAIASDLNRKNVPTKRGVTTIKMNGKEMQTCGKWKFGTVAKVLSNKTTAAWLKTFEGERLAA
jgi:DNA invertase Pin-like site-specific DNA recombinase